MSVSAWSRMAAARSAAGRRVSVLEPPPCLDASATFKCQQKCHRQHGWACQTACKKDATKKEKKKCKKRCAESLSTCKSSCIACD